MASFTLAPFSKGPESFSQEYAASLDAQDPLRELRKEFIIPTHDDTRTKRIADSSTVQTLSGQTKSRTGDECTYLCGNSLGLQPRRTRDYVERYLNTWAIKGVNGHWQKLEDGDYRPWVDMEEDLKPQMSKIVGAQESEIAVMETLTANLHLLMASFYRPTEERYKIIIEGKAFPSDHYAVQSQLHLHNLHHSEALVELNPPEPNSSLLPTSYILSVIDAHASSTAMLLLPGIQYYSGQLFDIPTITAYAQERGITVGWDLAHAVGNVPLQLHDWNVDFAAWCNYKYMNGGPGVIGGLFVHERHGNVASPTEGSNEVSEKGLGFRPRLSGWWGSEKSARFRMGSQFVPLPGAAGFRLSNQSVLDCTAVLASLSVYGQTTMQDLRAKSLHLTAYLEHLLFDDVPGEKSEDRPYSLITPTVPEERGAQLSLLLKPGMLDFVQAELESQGVIVDERRPDVIRVAPAPLYNNYTDAWKFTKIFKESCKKVLEAQNGQNGH
ncbi:kynureninase 1 [Phyllosticta capitalensis]|uniref:kynureninase 1 n=1 Tax=Phyllosticta capitalensis TaxID=121624 RepID=UPI0031314A27